jgi:hypothetical protein
VHLAAGVRDLPGKGCVFTLELARKPPPLLSVIDGGTRHQTLNFAADADADAGRVASSAATGV